MNDFKLFRTKLVYSSSLIIGILLVFCTFNNYSKAQTAVVPLDKFVLPDKLPAHPRLFFPGGIESEILKKAEKNVLLSELISILKIEADIKSENNWNIVCNSGMVNGALAIGDKYRKEAEHIIRYAIKYTPNLLVSFAPEGVFNEGPGYWSYNAMYMTLLFDNLNRIVKNDYGLPHFKGLNNTARCYIEQIGPTKMTFNFGDASSEGIDYSPSFFFLSRQYDQPDVAAFYRNLLKSAIDEYKLKGKFNFPRFFFLSIPWFDDSEINNEENVEKLTVFNGLTDILVFNGNVKYDDNRLYLAAKTGRPNWSHNQLDGGSFVLDCDGERWGIDMGRAGR